jgi:cell division protein FtsL
MAPRKSATKTEAQERARRAASEVMAREQRLLGLGEKFFLAVGEAEQILETAERRVAEIRAKATQDAAQAKGAQVRVVAGMKGERIAVAEIAQRLELSTTQVRALLKESPTRASTAAADGVADDEDAVTGDTAEAATPETVGV